MLVVCAKLLLLLLLLVLLFFYTLFITFFAVLVAVAALHYKILFISMFIYFQNYRYVNESFDFKPWLNLYIINA